MIALTRNQFVTLTTLAGCNLLIGIVYSLQAPFFPAEAEKKGASTTFAGLTLGIYELAGFAACPIVSGFLLRKLGTYACFHTGILTIGTAVILFGFLNRVNNTAAFISLSILLRILEAFGGASTFIPSYGFLSVLFPDYMGTAMAVMETMFAAGMAIGPPVGEALYQLGMGSETWSYTAPFLTMGIVMYLGAFLASYNLNTIEDIRKLKDKTSVQEEKKAMLEGDTETGDSCVEDIVVKRENFTTFLKAPRFFVFYLTTMSVSICLGFITCTLEPFLRQFHLTPMETGGMFLIFGGLYASSSSIWGFVCDRTRKPMYVALIGCVLTICAFTFMGPSIIIPMKPSLALAGTGLAAYGLGLGAIYVSIYLLMTNEAKIQGFPDTNTLSSAISALWLSGIHLGCFIGPVLGGALFEKFGFGVETTFLVILMSIVLILLLLAEGLNFGKSFPKEGQGDSISEKLQNAEKTPLLSQDRLKI